MLESAEFTRKLIIDLPTSLPDEAPLLGQMIAEDFAAVGLDVELRHYEDRTAYAHRVKDKRIHDLCCFDSSPLSTYRVLREKIKKQGWKENGILVVNVNDDRLNWPEKEIIKQIGTKIYKTKPKEDQNEK